MPDTTIGLATSFITFSRPGASGGGATTTDRDGRIKWAGHNLLTNSESFDASAWVKAFVTVTANQAAAPNGTTTADLVIPSTDNGTHQLYQNVTVPTGVSFTMGFFVKPNGYTKFALVENQQTGYYVTYNASGSGSVITESSATGTITPLANGWYYVTHTSVSGAASYRFALLVLPNSYTSGTFAGSWAGDGTSGMYVWGATIFRSDMQMQLNPAMPAGMQTYYPTTPRNLVGNTEDFNSWSTKSGLAATPVIVNTIVAPNGLQTADKIVENSSASTHYVAQTTASLTASPYVASVYAKAAERSFVSLGFDGLNAWFNLATGAVGTVESGLTATITAAGDGWYRCAVYRTVASAAAKTFAVYIANANNSVSYTGDGTSGIYLWGAQLSDSASLDTYVPQYGAAVTSAAYYAPRLDFDGATLSPKGLLVEEARTNLLLQSNGFDTASWTKTRSSAAFVSGTAPDGSTTIAKITEDSTASESHLVQISATVVNGTTYTWTVYAKAGERTWLCLYNSNVTQGKFFNLSTGALGSNFVGAPAASSITPVGNGWYRCSISFAATGTSATLIHYLATADNTAVYTGDGTSGLYLYGAQLEAGSFATSYIPTGSATATRAADVASVSTQAFPYSSSEGTIVANVTVSSLGGVAYALNDGTNANRIQSQMNASSFQFYVEVGSVAQASLAPGTISANSTLKVSGAYKENDFAASLNGSAVATDTSGTIPSVNTLSLGRLTAAGYLNGHIRQITYLPRRISNAELVARSA